MPLALPLSPCMFCLIYFNRFQPDSLVGLVLIFNWLVLIAALSLARFVREWGFAAVFTRFAHGETGTDTDHGS